MKYEIETYKDQTIYYDEQYDYFICDISIEDGWKQTKRNKLADVRKEIDSFIKANLNFKPFKALSYSAYGGVKEWEISSIRTDGKFVSGGKSNYNRHLDYKEVSEMKKFDQDIVDLDKEYSDRIDQLKKEKAAAIAEAYNKLPDLEVSKYKLS